MFVADPNHPVLVFMCLNKPDTDILHANRRVSGFIVSNYSFRFHQLIIHLAKI